MNTRTKSLIGICIVIVVFLLSVSVTSYGQDNGAVSIKNGDDVIQTVDNKVYVGKGVRFDGIWVILSNVRYPVDQGVKIGGIAFPSERIILIYHKGDIDKETFK